jgi:16S rRNA (guanine1207-N2)-methyltransferase
MTRWASDPERAADELIGRCLGAIDLGGRVLLANQSGTLPSTLAARGIDPAVWNRRLADNLPARPWPMPGPFDLALLRLPKARDEQEMAAHACLSVLDRAGALVVYGGNDEGIRPAAGMLERLCGRVETLATRGHGRVLMATRPDDLSTVRGALAEWRTVLPLAIGGSTRAWASYPGVFAAGRVDEGTALLIDALPAFKSGARLLDYGCGAGVVAAAVARHGGMALDLIDSDSVALEAARENVPGARLVLGLSLRDAGGRYDAILSNPPLHRGAVEDHGPLQRLIIDAPTHLATGGILMIVVQRRLPLDRLLARHLADVAIAAENTRYRVWHARNP